MKKLIVCCCLFVLASCARKSVPSKPNYSLNNGKNNTEMPADNTLSNPTNTDSIATVSENTISIITDGYGRLLTPQKSLPQDAGIQYNSLQLSKGFTPQQRANLQARYHGVPPRVLFVPHQLSLNSLKGDYYIYKQKFWYWKKPDGLYYLDSKYYL